MSKIDSIQPKNPLYLDVGNSSIKGAYKKGLSWEAIHAKKNYKASELVQWIDEHPETFSHIVFASVRDDVKSALQHELRNVDVVELSVNDIPSDLLDYRSIETLGIDRFLACFGATNQTRNSVVVIDAGTALTIDFMDQNDVYHGGIIAPGISGFVDVLHEKAPALPKVEMEIPKKWPGRSTEESLKWGQAGFYKMAVEAILKKYEDEFGHYDLFITGGEGNIVESILSRDSKLRPFLVFDGMKRLEERLAGS